jgi:NADP-dependent alcohol dehydrogenase
LRLKSKTGTIRKTHLQLRRYDDEIANEAINKTVEFFHKMEFKLSPQYDNTADFIVNRTKEDGALGENKISH